jgi:hypothetical protein
MGKLPDLSPRKKQAVRTLLSTGLSHRSVVEVVKRDYKFEISKSSVTRIAKEPNLVEVGNRVGKCGRRKKLSNRDVRYLRRLAKENRKLPSPKLADMFRNVTGSFVSHSCVLYNRRFATSFRLIVQLAFFNKIMPAAIRRNWCKIGFDSSK